MKSIEQAVDAKMEIPLQASDADHLRALLIYIEELD